MYNAYKKINILIPTIIPSNYALKVFFESEKLLEKYYCSFSGHD